MVIIENLSVINADLPNDLLLRLSIRNNSVVSSLIGSSGKVAGRRKGERKKSTIDKIKYVLNYCGSPSEKILTIKAILKDPIFCLENNYTDVVNIEK